MPIAPPPRRHAYLHGYDPREADRLRDQAGPLASLLHGRLGYAPGERVLEVGCGVGAQTVALLRAHPGIALTAIDIAADSLARADEAVRSAGLGPVEFRVADATDPPFAPASFDHVFVCFVLEHLPDPDRALATFARLLRPGGSLTAIEGDHGSALFHPENAAARRLIRCQIDLQRSLGGDAEIGRRLRPLLVAAGLASVAVEPRIVYADGSRPDLQRRFARDTFGAMIAGLRGRAIDAGLVGADEFDDGLAGLARSAEPDGTFFYAFFRATGIRPS